MRRKRLSLQSRPCWRYYGNHGTVARSDVSPTPRAASSSPSLAPSSLSATGLSPFPPRVPIPHTTSSSDLSGSDVAPIYLYRTAFRTSGMWANPDSSFGCSRSWVARELRLHGSLAVAQGQKQVCWPSIANSLTGLLLL